MKRGFIVEVADKKYYLRMTGEALFKFAEEFGSAKMDGGVIDKLNETGINGFNALCKILSILSECGENYRRFYGYDKSKILTCEKAQAEILPCDVLQIKEIAVKTIVEGFSREVEEEKEEIDLGLQELEKKTVKA